MYTVPKLKDHSAKALDKAVEKLRAAGVQVGTLFAYCDESGFASHLKQDVLDHAARGPGDEPLDQREHRQHEEEEGPSTDQDPKQGTRAFCFCHKMCLMNELV